MQNMKEKSNILSIKYYPCGYCINKLKYIIKNPTQKEKKFYAGVFLINHAKYGYILFDTGYSEEIYNCGIIGKIYNLVNPTHIKSNETIVAQLLSDGIELYEIKYIVLSHLHPDHIGCVKNFPNAKYIISKECLDEYKKGRFRSLIFKRMFPKTFEKNVTLVEHFDLNIESLRCFELFGESGIYLFPINGHFNGQIGLIMPELKLLIGADACWGMDYLDRVSEMHKIARLVQNDFEEYIKNITELIKLKNIGYKIYFSHDDYSKKELI